MTITLTSPRLIPLPYARAIARARKERLSARPLRLYGDGRSAFAVRSTTEPGDHVITLSPRGKIVDCSLCPGWENGHVCKHAGSVAWKILVARLGRREAQALLTRSLDVPALRVA